MISTPVEALQQRAEALVAALASAAPKVSAQIAPSVAYLGSGSLPTEAIPSVMVVVSAPGMKAAELGRHLRLDEAAVFGRIEDQLVRLDVRTVTDEQVPVIAAAIGRCTEIRGQV
jgi:L-seryl-tRNA(Ser) seleniumtransferase